MKEPRPILFADDNPLDVELTLSALREHHLANDIVVVHDGVQVMDYLRSRGRFSDRPPGAPAMILLDLKMPKRDGLEVLREIRADPALCGVPVVMLTSSREEQDVVRSYQLGVNSYVLKPVGFVAFAEAIKALGIYWTVHNESPATKPPSP